VNSAASAGNSPEQAPDSTANRFGYQPGLDGLRAVSVIAVLLYHAGFERLSGGFLGVEVFFVISGFLITSLLLEEHELHGRVSLRAFWIRRVKRLVPALVAVVIAVASWVALFGSPAERSSLRRELPWSLLYGNNWGQITGATPYFAAEADPLRHLWSLAVEEQWYLIWPLVFVLIARRIDRHSATHRIAAVGIAAVAAVSIIHMIVTASADGPLLRSPIGWFDGVDRLNFLYLSTTTRAGGLLLGAATAFAWRPWRNHAKTHRLTGRAVDIAALAALAFLLVAFSTAELTDRSVYLWVLPLTSVSSLILAAAVSHPDGRIIGSIASIPALVAIGRRSYGLYLWSWPISVAVGAIDGSFVAFGLAMAITAVVSETSYRWFETPLRRADWSIGAVRHKPIRLAATSGLFALTTVLTVVFVNVERFDPFQGDDVAEFDASAAIDPPPSPTSPEIGITTTTTISTTTTLGSPRLGDDAPSPATASTDMITSTTSTTTTTLAPLASTRLAIVGDSTANALAVNRPAGISEIYPTLVNRSRDGCSVFDSGRVLTDASFRNDFARCEGWQNSWSRAASESDVVLVVIGAWEVFDIADGDTTFVFASPEWDQHFVGNLRSGLDLIVENGARIGLLEVPCMRPVESNGTTLPPLPERGDDSRVAHVNVLLSLVAQDYGPTVRFIGGPDAWCSDESVSTDTSLRWDGVHVYGRGANMVYEATANAVLRLAAVPL